MIEPKEYIKNIKRTAKKVCASTKKAQTFLISTGIYTRNLKLSKHYK